MNKDRIYFCIDMKSFYASVECAERGLSPFETALVVADTTRGKNAICLAISPKLKAMGIKNRCRLNEIPPGVEYIIAMPRMQKYIDYSADIYSIYLDYFDPRDIHVYSIDEAFIDVTDYLKMYGLTPINFAKKLLEEIAERMHIPATAGIGTNLYLAKIALDITAKKNKTHIGYLDEKTYIETLWDHRPITDFWMVASGTANRLARYGIFDMKGVANASEELLYKIFGVNAELLIDHAWGRETCLMEDIKNYKTSSKSISSSQILPRNYTYEEARIVMEEMVINGCRELMKRKVIAGKVGIFVAYASGTREPTGGSTRLHRSTSTSTEMSPQVIKIYDETTDRTKPIRRIGIDFTAIADEESEGYDFFTDVEQVQRERDSEKTALMISRKYGKNAILRGINYLDAATQRERNEFIGGHRAGYDKRGKS